MTAGAWYHIDTLTKAADQYKAAISAKVEATMHKWEADKVEGWKWDSWFSLPKKRRLTLDETQDKYGCHFNPYWWLRRGAVEGELQPMEHYIGLARRSEQNLVYLETYEVRQFGGFLTINHETHEIIF